MKIFKTRIWIILIVIVIIIQTVTAKISPFAKISVTSFSTAEVSYSDFPSQYLQAADWIWNNRIMNEDSCGVRSKRYNLIFDQIIANKGQLNYVVRWQSTKSITYEQRESFKSFVEKGINKWTDYLVGFEGWPYDHVKVNIIGWAVIDKNSLIDLHNEEVIWTDTEFDELSNSQPGVPSQLPVAPEDLWTFNFFTDRTMYIMARALMNISGVHKTMEISLDVEEIGDSVFQIIIILQLHRGMEPHTYTGMN